MTTISNQLQELLGADRIKEHVRLAPYATFKMGGPAEYYYEALDEDDISKAIKVAHGLNIPVLLLGGASNLVIRDQGIKGLVIRNVTLRKEVVFEDDLHVVLHVSSGYSMTRLAKETAENGWQGLEYHLGLPGSVGGALYMNSKWIGSDGPHYVGDCVKRVELVNEYGEPRTVDKEYFNFAYDYSKIQETHEYVVWAEFDLKKANPIDLIARGKESLAYRKKTQPFGAATSGCFFKNVNGVSAGKLIDDAGLKGFKIGGAYVSDIHANFILNDGTATTADVEKIIQEIISRVKEKYQINLEQEIVII